MAAMAAMPAMPAMAAQGRPGSARGSAAVPDLRLVAYVVPRTAAAPGLEELRAHLARRLPDYMLPAALVVLDALPLTTSGKIDRRALPEAVPGGERASRYEAPRTALEQFLAGLWQEALGVERVGVHDDFFALGGNSISGAILINR